MTAKAKVSRDKLGSRLPRKGRGAAVPPGASESEGFYKTAMRYSRKGVPSLPYVASVVDIPSGEMARPIRPPKKTEEERWLTMAAAMDGALDRMRTMYELLLMWQDVEVAAGGNPANLQPLLDETAACANLLKHGLKAR